MWWENGYLFGEMGGNEADQSRAQQCVRFVAAQSRNPVPTVGGARKEVLLLIGVPRNDLNEVGHKRRYQTLDDGRIAADHVLLVHVRLVVLSHDCGWRRVELVECALRCGWSDSIIQRCVAACVVALCVRERLLCLTRHH